MEKRSSLAETEVANSVFITALRLLSITVVLWNETAWLEEQHGEFMGKRKMPH